MEIKSRKTKGQSKQTPAASIKDESNRSKSKTNLSKIDHKPLSLFSLQFLIKLIQTICVSFLFGFAIQKGRVYEPKVIQQQLALTDFTMMQVFLSAVGTSLLFVGLFPSKAKKLVTYYVEEQTDRGMLVVSVGASILGVGMALAGACPGTVFSQNGALISTSPFVLLGGIVGIFAAGAIQPYLQKNYYKVGLLNQNSLFLQNLFNCSPSLLRITIATLLFTFVAIFNIFLPNSHYKGPHTPLPTSLINFLTQKEWPPIIAGLGIGLVQILSLLFNLQPLAMSSHLVALLSQPLALLIPQKRASKNHDIGTWIRTENRASGLLKSIYLFGTIAGSYAAFLSSGGVLRDEIFVAPGVSHMRQAFFGGGLLFFGARVANGCTSGHGITGLAALGGYSVLAVACMFGAGIGMGLWISKFGRLV